MASPPSEISDISISRKHSIYSEATLSPARKRIRKVSIQLSPTKEQYLSDSDESLNSVIKEYGQFDKYIKSIVEEPKHLLNQKGNMMYNSQISKASSVQKSQIQKQEEKNYKLTFQQFINYDEKNKHNKTQGPELLLNDIDDQKLSHNNKIIHLLKLLETHSEGIVDKEYCKNLQDVVMLELHQNLSPKALELIHSDKPKRKKNNNKVICDMLSSPNDTLTNINNGLLTIEDICDVNKDQTHTHSASEYENEESEDDFSNESSDNIYNECDDEDNQSPIKKNSSEHSYAEDNNTNNNSIIIEPEEINDECRQKLVFYDELKRKDSLHMKHNTNFTIDSNTKYILRKKHFQILQSEAYSFIKKLIDTDSKFLPKYRSNMHLDDLITEIENLHNSVDSSSLLPNAMSKPLMNRASIFQFVDNDDNEDKFNRVFSNEIEENDNKKVTKSFTKKQLTIKDQQTYLYTLKNNEFGLGQIYLYLPTKHKSELNIFRLKQIKNQHNTIIENLTKNYYDIVDLKY